LPKEFRFDGDRVFIKRLGNAVVLIPYQEPWQSLFDSLDAAVIYGTLCAALERQGASIGSLAFSIGAHALS
jgi:hypothetical protein